MEKARESARQSDLQDLEQVQHRPNAEEVQGESPEHRHYQSHLPPDAARVEDCEMEQEWVEESAQESAG